MYEPLQLRFGPPSPLAIPMIVIYQRLMKNGKQEIIDKILQRLQEDEECFIGDLLRGNLYDTDEIAIEIFSYFKNKN